MMSIAIVCKLLLHSIHLIGCGLNVISTGADSIHLTGCGLNAISADSIHHIGCGLNAVNVIYLFRPVIYGNLLVVVIIFMINFLRLNLYIVNIIVMIALLTVTIAVS
jgi:hypothetical protein